MELKFRIWEHFVFEPLSFNRTAYGIEIRFAIGCIDRGWTFNRTAYGIEIQQPFIKKVY